LVPQAPQLEGSVWKAELATHLPLQQVLPEPHLVLHVPQLLGSVVSVAHLPLQQAEPG
jgi:hypothetical protein